jgi:hypothetical protein
VSATTDWEFGQAAADAVVLVWRWQGVEQSCRALSLGIAPSLLAGLLDWAFQLKYQI